jgi:hypothetical protein
MPSMFVRGNMLSVLNADAHTVSNKGLVPGDLARVGARKKGGWLRVRCSRTGEVISIRSGHHLCLASKAVRPASQIDLLIRESQLKSAETTIQEVTESRDMWIARAEASSERVRTLQQEFSDRKKWWEEELAETQQNSKNEIESLGQQLAIVHRLLDQATKQNAELLDETSVLQDELKKSEAKFAESRADMGWIEMSLGFVPTDEETTAADALVMMSNGGTAN